MKRSVFFFWVCKPGYACQGKLPAGGGAAEKEEEKKDEPEEESDEVCLLYLLYSWQALVFSAAQAFPKEIYHRFLITLHTMCLCLTRACSGTLACCKLCCLVW